MQKKCGLLLIKEVDHEFSLEFIEHFANLHTTIFPILQIPVLSFINILLCDKQRSTQLNSQFGRATDVLSWRHDLTKLQAKISGDFPFGEIAICFEICQKQSIANNWSFDVEFTRLLVHGLAHLGGYSHDTLDQEKNMLAKEKTILSFLKMNFVYLS